MRWRLVPSGLDNQLAPSTHAHSVLFLSVPFFLEVSVCFTHSQRRESMHFLVNKTMQTHVKHPQLRRTNRNAQRLPAAMALAPPASSCHHLSACLAMLCRRLPAHQHSYGLCTPLPHCPPACACRSYSARSRAQAALCCFQSARGHSTCRLHAGPQYLPMKGGRRARMMWHQQRCDGLLNARAPTNTCTYCCLQFSITDV